MLSFQKSMVRPSRARLLTIFFAFAISFFHPRKISAQRSAPSVSLHSWRYGIATENLLDTYLSPYAYSGLSYTISHQTAHYSPLLRGDFTINTSGRAAYLSGSNDKSKMADFNLSADFLFSRQKRLGEKWSFACGAGANSEGGFTYHLRNGNNPAQIRWSGSLMVAVSGAFAFRLFRKTLLWKTNVSAPLLGVRFAPEYGESYYELFSLKQYSRNFFLATPFNAPSLRILSGLSIPLGKTSLFVGYQGIISQYSLSHLKYHAWNNGFVAGYSRRFQLLP